jgi:nitrous oxidase accessory protein NosD
MRVKMTFAVLALAVLALALPASSLARSRVVHVGPGESIQAAVDAARPGTTIRVEAGTYAEAVTIAKDGIELEGEGRKKTHIVPPPGPSDCFAPTGICVTDAANPDHVVRDVEISHLSVEGSVFGIAFFNARDGEVDRTILFDYEAYGLFANTASGLKITRNVTYNSVAENHPEAGIYIGDSPDADAKVWKNVAWGNLFGIFIRDASHGKVRENKTFSNCVGILFLNTDAPDDLAHWLAEDNNVTANNRQCPAGEEAPPLSGSGIAILGGDDIDLIDNGVFGNRAAAGFQSAFEGGIIVSPSPFGQAPIPSTDIKVGFNTAFGNNPDLVVEEGAQVKLFANDCLTSRPDGLCVDSEDSGDRGNGKGNGHHGDGKGHHGDDDDDDDHADRNHKKGKKHHRGGKHSRSSKNKKRHKHHDD